MEKETPEHLIYFFLLSSIKLLRSSGYFEIIRKGKVQIKNWSSFFSLIDNLSTYNMHIALPQCT